MRVTSEDYNWIFQKCAQVDSKNQTLKSDFFRENRKLYILSYGLGSIETVRNAANYIKEKNRSYDYDRDDSKRYFYDLFNALMEEGAAIRIIAGDTFDGDPARGVILISLPGEMPLRIHAAITLGLPHLSAQEVCIKYYFLPHTISNCQCAQFLSAYKIPANISYNQLVSCCDR